ncbi:pentapeptide repeat protein [Lachnospiraceae bacterium oral taxon 082 str. F0431]|nr:pentapeptide repeat protein [Lachnospiraceae bacterium oral taxon 082 str. F0431]
MSGEHLEGLAFDDRALSQASFRGAYLDGAKFIDAILVGVDFEGASLVDTDFSCANAWSANFNETNCKDALFLSANLTEASFEGADLDGASFALANLTEASLEDAQNIDLAEFDNTVGIYPVCPDTGSFIGWTIGEDEEGNEYLVEILLPWSASKFSGTTRRCRANGMYINDITPIGESLEDDECPDSVKLKNRDFKLSLGETSTDENFEVDRFKVSSTDLYFYITKEEALAQARKRI